MKQRLQTLLERADPGARHRVLKAVDVERNELVRKGSEAGHADEEDGDVLDEGQRLRRFACDVEANATPVDGAGEIWIDVRAEFVGKTADE